MSEVIQRNVDEVNDIAARKGLECFIAERDELLIDLDGHWHNSVFDRVRDVISQNNSFQILSRLETTSPGGEGKHVYIQLDRKINNSTRIALQACLGSDPVREVLSIIRHLVKSDAPTALFETEREAQKVTAWRKRKQVVKKRGPIANQVG